MAKARATAPGTHVKGGVHKTFDPPFGHATKGTQKNLPGTFDAPRSGGDNGLPTRVTDPTGGPKAGGTGQTSARSSAGRTLTDSKDRR